MGWIADGPSTVTASSVVAGQGAPSVVAVQGTSSVVAGLGASSVSG